MVRLPEGCVQCWRTWQEVEEGIVCVSGAGGSPCSPGTGEGRSAGAFCPWPLSGLAEEQGLSCDLRLWSAHLLGPISAPGSHCPLHRDTLRQHWGRAWTWRQDCSAQPSLCPEDSRLPSSPQWGPACRSPAGTAPGACLGCPCSCQALSPSVGPDLTGRFSLPSHPPLPGEACSLRGDTAPSALWWAFSPRTCGPRWFWSPTSGKPLSAPS